MPASGLSRYIAMDPRDPELEMTITIATRGQRVGSVLILKSSFIAIRSSTMSLITLKTR